MTANIDIQDVQEQVKHRVKRVRNLAHKAALTSLGAVGLTCDAGRAVLHRTGEIVHKAETRGEEIEAKFQERVHKVQEEVSEEVHAQRAKVEEQLDSISKGVTERGKAVEQRVQSKLSALKPGRSTVVETDQIKIEVEVIESEPWEGYDELNAQEVIERLADLDADQLETVRQYEMNSKNRVTVLRELDMRQAALEEEQKKGENGSEAAPESSPETETE